MTPTNGGEAVRAMSADTIAPEAHGNLATPFAYRAKDLRTGRTVLLCPECLNDSPDECYTYADHHAPNPEPVSYSRALDIYEGRMPSCDCCSTEIPGSSPFICEACMSPVEDEFGQCAKRCGNRYVRPREDGDDR